MIQVLTIQRKMRVYSQNWVQFFALCCSCRHYCSPSNVYKFNMVLTFQNLKNVDIVYNCFINEFYMYFHKAIVTLSRIFYYPPFGSPPQFKAFFCIPLSTLIFGKSYTPLTKGGVLSHLNKGGHYARKSCHLSREGIIQCPLF